MRASAPTESPSPEPSWRARELVLLCAITLLAGAARLYGVRDWSLTAAEVATWRAVTMPLDGDGGFFASDAAHHPLVLLVLRWLLDHGVLGNLTEGWLRLPFVFVGTLTVPLLALACALVASRATALLAAGLLAVHPWHVAASQSAAPPVVAAALVLAAVGAWLAPGQRRWILRALGCIAAAGACAADRSGCVVVPLLLAGACARRWRPNDGRGTAPGGRRAMWLVAALATVALPLLLQTVLGWPFAPRGDGALSWWAFVWPARPAVVALAVLAAWLWRPTPVPLLLALAAVVAGLAVVAAAGADVAPTDLFATLPFWMLLAAAAATAVGGRVLAASDGLPRLVGAGVVPTALACLLLVDTTLRATVYEGHNSPWREVRDVVLHERQPGRGLVVGAAEGAPSLTFYLRPNHWRDAGRDPHPGVRVARLEGEPAAAVAALAGDDDGDVRLLVLRSDEYEALQQGDALRRDWELREVLPCPREHGDGTLYLLARRSP